MVFKGEGLVFRRKIYNDIILILEIDNFNGFFGENVTVWQGVNKGVVGDTMNFLHCLHDFVEVVIFAA